MASSETFGYEPDENGEIVFETITTDFEIYDFDSYGDFVKAYFHRIAGNNQVMPIVTFPKYGEDAGKGNE